jgi:hypothetical protein
MTATTTHTRPAGTPLAAPAIRPATMGTPDARHAPQPSGWPPPAAEVRGSLLAPYRYEGRLTRDGSLGETPKKVSACPHSYPA